MEHTRDDSTIYRATLSKTRDYLGILLFLTLTLALPKAFSAEEETLPGTQPLTSNADFSIAMRVGFDRFLDRLLSESVANRQKLWNRNLSSPQSYIESVQGNRDDFRKTIGAVDSRLPVKALEYESSTLASSLVAEDKRIRVSAVRWPVLNGVDAEGLLLEPKGKIAAKVIVIPDADQSPEMIAGLSPGLTPEQQMARRLAAAGCQVLVPVLIDRKDTWSGNPKILMTTEPHREWIYRQAYGVGRHIIGYEVQKVMAGVDWLRTSDGGNQKIGVAGYGEGGLIAFYSAAIDQRIDGALVSGYFDSRQKIYDEPLYRNVFGLLAEFGDAEIASLVAPKKLIVEYSQGPQIEGPAAATNGRRATGAPGSLGTPAFDSVNAEVQRVKKLLEGGGSLAESVQLVAGPGGTTVGPMSNDALAALLKALQVVTGLPQIDREALIDRRKDFSPETRMHRQVTELVDYTQHLALESQSAREEFWKEAKPDASLSAWIKDTEKYRDYYWREVIGRLPEPNLPFNPRTRKVAETPKWIAYEVVLDVWPEVIDWGYLLLPKGIAPGERRPVVVCQHGLESLPKDVFQAEPGTVAFGLYHNYGARLADEGFVVSAPHNFYRGGDQFRQLQRKANPLKLTLWSITVGQHTQLLDWLSSLPFVDSNRMAFYGLSYGGATAMYVPPVVKRYSLVICAGNFTELIRKTVSIDNPYSLVFYHTYEATEFNFADTFGYAEFAALIAPRPFMVERGHFDTVSPDEWIGYEFARVRRIYDLLGLSNRARVEFFNGPHTIHGAGTFEFLHEFLNWPQR